MEHIFDPVFLLESIKKIMSRGKSLLWISLPNDFNPLQTRLMDRCGYPPYFLSYPDHKNYFNFESLKKILEGTGYKILELYCDFPMELFLLFGRNYINDQELGKVCHAERLAFEKSFIGEEGHLLNLYKSLATQGIGRVAYALATI